MTCFPQSCPSILHIDCNSLIPSNTVQHSQFYYQVIPACFSCHFLTFSPLRCPRQWDCKSSVICPYIYILCQAETDWYFREQYSTWNRNRIVQISKFNLKSSQSLRRSFSFLLLCCSAGVICCCFIYRLFSWFYSSQTVLKGTFLPIAARSWGCSDCVVFCTVIHLT